MELGATTSRGPDAGERLLRPRDDHGVEVLHRVRRIVLVAVMVTLVPVVFSYVGTMAEPSNSSLGVRTVEWLRDHGAAGLVSQVESTYYSLTAPGKGGPALRALPKVGYNAAGPAVGRAGLSAVLPYQPPRVAPLVRPELPGEGSWRSTRSGLGAQPPLLLTTLRNQPEYPRVVAGLAWIDTKRTTLTLNPGRMEPSVPVSRGTMDVPYAKRGRLLATFNSGFKLGDSHGGFVLNGRTYAKMRNGQATLVGYTNGQVDVVNWSYGAIAPGTVSFARQNLPLLVNEGRASPNLDSSEWGVTVGNAVLVWRSGIGVDAHGNLIYAAGDNQTVGSLAHTLIHAGAIRAMELDINSYWVSFITYGAPGAGEPLNLLPNMSRSAERYLTPDDRDFFAVYAH